MVLVVLQQRILQGDAMDGDLEITRLRSSPFSVLVVTPLQFSLRLVLLAVDSCDLKEGGLSSSVRLESGGGAPLMLLLAAGKGLPWFVNFGGLSSTPFSLLGGMLLSGLESRRGMSFKASLSCSFPLVYGADTPMSSFHDPLGFSVLLVLSFDVENEESGLCA
jgi:hypothetical protein